MKYKFLLHLFKSAKSKFFEEYQVFKKYTHKGVLLFGNNKLFNCVIGEYSYVSFNSILFHCEIGRYCSIGPNVVIGFGDHMITSLSTHPAVYMHDILLQDEKERRSKDSFKKVIICNDVWIGANVYVKNGVRIGNGAIIGAGSIVVKDVPDFAIAVGVPAKVIRYRFEPLTIEKIMQSKWWDRNVEEIGPEIIEFENNAK